MSTRKEKKMKSFSNLLIVSFAALHMVSATSEKQTEYNNFGETGYSMGFIPDCPGSWKPADIRPKSLKKLSLAVMGPGDLMDAKWKKYNYYHVGDVAKDPNIDFKNKKTFIFIPGYLDNLSFPLGRGLGHIYRKLGFNVLLMELVHFTTNVLPITSRMMRPVGKYTAEMLANLTANHGLDPKDIEIVGLSLGAQTMSFIAKNYRQITGRNISTLIALEPTGPCFRNLGPDQRIDKSDADFVLSIATNIDGFGMATPVGHVTFYVNGGEWQPGDVWWFPCGLMCSHSRSFQIWVAALENPGSFIGMQCDTVQHARKGDCYDKKPMVSNTLDRFTDRTKPGIYYLATSNIFPYYLGKKGVEKTGEKIMKHFIELNKADMIWV